MNRAQLSLYACIFLSFVLSIVICETGTPGTITNTFVVEIHNKTIDVEKLAREHGYSYVRKIGNLENFHLFKLDESIHPVKRVALPNLEDHPSIHHFEQQVVLHRSKRNFVLPQDPLFSQQWHLHSTTGTTPHINAVAAWEAGYTGVGVTVAIVDDGLEKDNPDLKANFNVAGSYDFMESDNNPTPISIDEHGTSASGCVGAVRNTNCGVGVAYESKISGIRIMKGNDGLTDAGEGSALSYLCEHVNDVYTCSWGPWDDGKRLEGPGRVAKTAIENCIQHGRDGKGTIYVWAAGNGRPAGDNINYDGYANHRYTIAIGAYTDDGQRPYYAERGSPLMAVTPSNGGRRGIVTTGLTSSDGCTSSFGGTSAASPIAAGAVAVMLQANPNLGWRDVQHIIVKTSEKNGATGWQQNGGGLYFSHDFGFGLLNVGQMVTTAKTWVNVPESKIISSGEIRPSHSSIDKSQTETYEFSVSDNDGYHGKFSVEHVQVIFYGTLTYRGEFELSLVSPHGTTSYLQERHTRDRESRIDGWSYWSVANWDENPVGTWKLVVKNSSSAQKATVDRFTINIYGYVKP